MPRWPNQLMAAPESTRVWSMAWTMLTGESRAAFRRTADQDSGTWTRARGWALWKSLLTFTDQRTTDPGLRTRTGSSSKKLSPTTRCRAEAASTALRADSRLIAPKLSPDLVADWLASAPACLETSLTIRCELNASRLVPVLRQ